MRVDADTRIKHLIKAITVVVLLAATAAVLYLAR